MNKPRIFIAIHYLEIGGAEAALIGLLDAMDYDMVDVDLFVYRHSGEFMKYVPAKVNLLPEIKEYAMIEAPIKNALIKGCFKVVAGRLLAKLHYNLYRHKNKPLDGNAIFGYIGKYVTPGLPDINNINYELAISFLTPHNIIADKINAKYKICWIHTDYSNIDVDTTIELPVWQKFDKIVSISSAVTTTFSSVFPSLTNRILEIENILPVSLIKKRAFETDCKEISKDNFNILSIGRFTYQKNFDSIPEICSELIRLTGLENIRWYIIGFGGDENLIRKHISMAGMENHVIILGKKDNPYPYIHACDLYVQPSRYEGKSIAVREAQAFGKPVVITDYSTAKSQVENGIDGLIVPLDNSKCAEGIANVIQDKSLRHNLSVAASNRDYSNKSEISKIYSLL